MSVPDLVRQRIDDEPVDATVELGDDDQLVVTPTRTIIYRGEGLIRDASVEEYAHDAEAVSVEEGRRAHTIRLDHGIDGASEFSVPADRLEAILPSVLQGVLRVAGVIESEESVADLFRLGELTLVVCDHRVLKQIGNAVWDAEAESYAFADVTGLDVEEGEVSSQIIVELEGRPQRIKVPTDEARRIRRAIQDALLAHHEVADYGEFVRLQSDDEEAADGESTADGDGEEAASESGGIEFGGGTGGSEESIDLQAAGDREAGGSQPDVAEELAALRESVQRQNDLLEAQQRTIQQLIEELREL